jgi:hypothetical protein
MQSLLQPGFLPLELQKKQQRRPVVDRSQDGWKALDTKHPIYNFLVEYYNIKGAKGTRRLGRWSPDPSLIHQMDTNNVCNNKAVERLSLGQGGIFLEGATPDDMGGTLYLRGATLVEGEGGGVLYSPGLEFRSKKTREEQVQSATPHMWYASILQATLESEPILHCFGLHEWAMQYHPEGAPPPPSAKYQSHLPLRVSREVINETVERKGVSCTHVDALRFFAPAAASLNHHGSVLVREQQVQLEQKACVHAHMDLLKIAMRLTPYIDADLVGDCLEIALKARELDVKASPYELSTDYGLEAIPVETSDGRQQYRDEQVDLMHRTEPIRQRLLDTYNEFINQAFDPDILEKAIRYPSKERFAKAEPGGLPWRHNLVAK